MHDYNMCMEFPTSGFNVVTLHDMTSCLCTANLLLLKLNKQHYYLQVQLLESISVDCDRRVMAWTMKPQDNRAGRMQTLFTGWWLSYYMFYPLLIISTLSSKVQNEVLLL